MRRSNKIIRLFDILISFFGLILVSPLFIIISVLIILESKGGIFFIQKRIGQNFKEFNLIKFRTMYLNSEKHGLLTVGDNDLRITKCGNLLRKYKFDELPQLLNVFFGDMSMVGPRPEVSKYVKYYTPEQQEVLKIRPGITDYASIEYKNENALLSNSQNPEQLYITEIIPRKIQKNLIFINNYTIKEYLKIIILTLKSIFT